MKLITAWFNRNFSDPQVVILGLALVILLAAVLLFGRMLAPVLAAIVIAYLLDGLIAPLQYRGTPRIIAVLIVYLAFLLSLIHI